MQGRSTSLRKTTARTHIALPIAHFSGILRTTRRKQRKFALPHGYQYRKTFRSIGQTNLGRIIIPKKYRSYRQRFKTVTGIGRTESDRLYHFPTRNAPHPIHRCHGHVQRGSGSTKQSRSHSVLSRYPGDLQLSHRP